MPERLQTRETRNTQGSFFGNISRSGARIGGTIAWAAVLAYLLQFRFPNDGSRGAPSFQGATGATPLAIFVFGILANIRERDRILLRSRHGATLSLFYMSGLNLFANPLGQAMLEGFGHEDVTTQDQAWGFGVVGMLAGVGITFVIGVLRCLYDCGTGQFAPLHRHSSDSDEEQDFRMFNPSV